MPLPNDPQQPWTAIVIGAGAAGLLAAARAAELGRRTLLLEKNRKPGVKILMSGGTRCNLTQATDARGIVEAYGTQGRFLHSALAALGPRELVELFHAEGVPTKVEPTGKVFPVSDRATDVLAALLARLQRSGATLALGEPARDVRPTPGGFEVTTTERVLHTEKVLVTTGGQSYPGCGTTGDGYRWLAELGHTIVPPRPALVPLTANPPWLKSLQGITLPDVEVRVRDTAAESHTTWLAQRRGSLLFAHFGLSGPVALDVSRVVSGHPRPTQLELVCDLLPDRSAESLDLQLRDRASAEGKKQLANVLDQALPELPRRLIEVLLGLVGVRPEDRAAELSKPTRLDLCQRMKQFAVRLTGTLGFKKAEVTAGGVALDEVDSRSMQSKRVPGLYLAGEILDLDGPIGGYNFQAAFSTGWLAAERM